MKRLLSTCICAAGVLCASTAHAQMSFSPGWASWGGAVTGGSVMAGLAERSRRSPSPGRMGAVTAGRATAPAPTTYRADPALTASVRRQFVERVKQADPKTGAAVERLLATTDVFRAWDQQVGSEGLRRGDAADAVAAYWVMSWMISHRDTASPPGALRGVSAQVDAALGRNPAFIRLSDSQRQEMAEIFIYDTIIPASLFGAALQRRDSAAVSQASAAAMSDARAMLGVDLRALRLTPHGFVRA